MIFAAASQPAFSAGDNGIILTWSSFSFAPARENICRLRVVKLP